MMVYDYFAFRIQDSNGLHESMPTTIEPEHTMPNMWHFVAVPMINLQQL
jgi:hypothetical protein